MTQTIEEKREYGRKYRKNNPEKIKEYYKKNKDKLKEKRKKYCENNPEKIKEHKKKYYQKHKEEIKAKARVYYQEHKERALKQKKEYFQGNKGEIKKYREKYKERRNTNIKHRRRIDLEFVIKDRIKNSFRYSLTYYTKTGKIMTSKKYGVDYKAIIEHLKPLPKDLSNYEIHHIKPLCSFKFINSDGTTNLKEVKKAWCPKNLILLTKKQHRKLLKYSVNGITK